MKPTNYNAKAAHFSELAARAAYQAAACLSAGLTADAEAWDERAARYDGQAAAYHMAARKAA